MAVKKINNKIKISFDAKAFDPYEFERYYLEMGNFNTGSSKAAVREIEYYFNKYSPDAEYDYQCYENCPKEVQEEITRIILDVVTGQMMRLISDDNKLHDIVFGDDYI